MTTSDQHAPRYSVMISTDNINNNIRIASPNSDATQQIIAWYQQLTKKKVNKDKKARYVNAFILDSALTQAVFGVDWITIMVSYMLSIGFELVGDLSTIQQLKSIMFISTKETQLHLNNYKIKPTQSIPVVDSKVEDIDMHMDEMTDTTPPLIQSVASAPPIPIPIPIIKNGNGNKNQFENTTPLLIIQEQKPDGKEEKKEDVKQLKASVTTKEEEKDMENMTQTANRKKFIRSQRKKEKNNKRKGRNGNTAKSAVVPAQLKSNEELSADHDTIAKNCSVLSDLNVEQMCIVILHCVGQVKLVANVRLIRNLVKNDMELSGKLFDQMGESEFAQKFRNIGFTRGIKLYHELRRMTEKEMNKILSESAKRKMRRKGSKSIKSSTKKSKTGKQSTQPKKQKRTTKKRVELERTSDDNAINNNDGSEDSEGF